MNCATPRLLSVLENFRKRFEFDGLAIIRKKNMFAAPI